MLSNAALQEKLDQSPSNFRLTVENLEARITAKEFTRSETGTMTMCILTMENGFQVLGKSACADPANYNKQIGEKVAYDDAFRQLWALEGYLLREHLLQTQK